MGSPGPPCRPSPTCLPMMIAGTSSIFSAPSRLAIRRVSSNPGSSPASTGWDRRISKSPMKTAPPACSATISANRRFSWCCLPAKKTLWRKIPRGLSNCWRRARSWPISVRKSSWWRQAPFANRCAASPTGKILIADRDTADVAATLGLFTRSFHNRQQNVVRVPEMHAEFLIDRSGYIRARWLPVEDDLWSDPAFIETQLEMLSREPPAPPPPDVHSQHCSGGWFFIASQATPGREAGGCP